MAFDDSFWRRAQTIDSRYIYTALIAAILIPLFCPKIHYINIPSRQSLQFYNTVNQVAKESPDKLVLISSDWTASTRGENQWQTVAVITHLMRDHLHFGLLSFDPQNNALVQSIIDDLAPKYGYIYGRDYVNFGYRPSSDSVFKSTLKGLVVDIPGTLTHDVHNTSLSKIPLMQGVKDINQIGAIIDITPTDSIDAYVGLVQGVNKTPLLYATTAIGGPKYYPYLDSGQISGMLTGVKGAGDYEALMGTSNFGTRATGALSFVYALIILLIVVGNIGYYRTRHSRRNIP